MAQPVPDARPAAGRGRPATAVPADAVPLHGADRAGQEPGEHRPAGRAGVPPTAALEKRDAEVYNLLKAGHDLQEYAGAVVDVHGLQVKEAAQGIGLAERQLDRTAAPSATPIRAGSMPA